ncbi:MAG: sodium:calcium antiporter, partial [Oscillospiraceae bacterium]|nr:sodium:calcium antiporter [Oscillospiraceae bacterium]
MESLLMYVLFAVGLALIVKGGDVFVDAASWIAKALNIPTFIIGATIVSLATTMPEALVSVIAAMDGKNDMAVGNAVGSVTANTGLIMALAMVSMSVVCSREKYLKQCILLISVAVVITLSCLNGRLSVFGSVVMALI